MRRAWCVSLRPLQCRVHGAAPDVLAVFLWQQPRVGCGPLAEPYTGAPRIAGHSPSYHPYFEYYQT